MHELDRFVFSKAPNKRMVSFLCTASTNCSTVYTRSKLVACRTHLASGSYPFLSASAHIPLALQKPVPLADYSWCLLPLHPGQSHCQRLVQGSQRYQNRTSTRDLPRHFISPLKHFLPSHIHFMSLLRIITKKKNPIPFLRSSCNLQLLYCVEHDK